MPKKVELNFTDEQVALIVEIGRGPKMPEGHDTRSDNEVFEYVVKGCVSDRLNERFKKLQQEKISQLGKGELPFQL